MEFFFAQKLYSSVHVRSTQYQSVPKGWSYPTHRHQSIEIMYCDSGEISEWVDGKQHRLRAGEAILIHSEAFHHPEAHADSVFLNFHFEIEPREIHRMFSSIEQPVLSSRSESAPWPDVQARFGKLIELFRCANSERESELSQRSSYVVSLLKLQSELLEMIGDMIANVYSPKECPSHADDGIQPFQMQLAHEAATLIQQSVHEIVHISQIAERLSIHRNYLTNSFKKVFGVSPKQYLIQERTKKAKQMLQETGLTMNDIAECMSFSSTGHFCRFFREQTGQTPYQYRSMGNMIAQG